MSKWSGRPVKSNSSPRKYYRADKYRDAFVYLCKDFEDRCAYSLVHISDMAKMEMEVDHFDLRLKKKTRQPYLNLAIAYRPCNNGKRTWPVKSQEALGCRYLNPRTEVDYGIHIFEDPDSHKVWGATVEGRWQVEKLNLNDPFLVRRRADRSRWKQILEARAAKVFTVAQGEEPSAAQALSEIKRLRDFGIPDLPLRKNPEPDLDDLETIVLKTAV